MNGVSETERKRDKQKRASDKDKYIEASPKLYFQEELIQTETETETGVTKIVFTEIPDREIIDSGEMNRGRD